MSHRALTIGTQRFATQQELKSYVRSLFEGQGDSFIANQDTHHFLMLLLPRHCKYSQKILGGIKAFQLDKKVTQKATWFECTIIRPDGSMASLSINALITAGRARSPLLDNLEAMRVAIMPCTMAFKFNSNQQCAKCSSFEYTEVDHCGGVEFREIAQRFIDQHGLCTDIGKINSKWGFMDLEYTDKWIKFHNELATLLCKTCHAKKTAATRTSKKRKMDN
jgi:hypothetical protein